MLSNKEKNSETKSLTFWSLKKYSGTNVLSPFCGKNKVRNVLDSLPLSSAGLIFENVSSYHASHSGTPLHLCSIMDLKRMAMLHVKDFFVCMKTPNERWGWGRGNDFRLFFSSVLCVKFYL